MRNRWGSVAAILLFAACGSPDEEWQETPPPTCDPVGTWTMRYTALEATCELREDLLIVDRDEHGTIAVDYGFDPDERSVDVEETQHHHFDDRSCTLVFQRTVTWRRSEEGNREDRELFIRFDGDEATGALVYYDMWHCGGLAREAVRYAVDAARQLP